MAYCENNVECRRAQTLSHFDEDFDCMQCKSGCDNCSSKVISTTRDVTAEAQGIVRIVEHLMNSQSQPRINIVAEIFREAKTKGVEKFKESDTTRQQLSDGAVRVDVHFGCSPLLSLLCSLPQYGCGRGWTVVDANRLIHLMLKEDILEEYGVASQNSQFPTDMMYLRLGQQRDVSWGSTQETRGNTQRSEEVLTAASLCVCSDVDEQVEWRHVDDRSWQIGIAQHKRCIVLCAHFFKLRSSSENLVESASARDHDRCELQRSRCVRCDRQDRATQGANHAASGVLSCSIHLVVAVLLPLEIHP